ncbi:MAG: iron(III) transport system substrate-binding protein [Candidatus Atribacteria bacterium]|nr:iron(III) transport system substrate-binding protein [Candidatus Atribacteria bacterium]
MISLAKKTFLLFTVVLVLISLFMAASVYASESLIVYSPLHEEEIARILDKFSQETGIKTEFIRLSAGAVAARLIAEKDRPMADVFFGGSAESHESLIGEGILRPYQSPVLQDIDPSFYHPEYYWSGFYVGAIGFAINNNRFKQKYPDKEYPATWEDLLDPNYKGEISMASPAASGTAYTIVATQFFRLGEEKAWEYLEELDKNIAFYTSAGAAPAQHAAIGECIIGIAFGHDVMKLIQSGYDLNLVYPKDTGWEVGAVSIVKDGPNPEAAEKFVDWILSVDGQQLHSDISLRVATHPEVVLPEGSTPISDLQLVDYDYGWAGQNRERIVEEWNNRFLD